MKVQNLSVSFDSFDEVQMYIRAARSLHTKGAPSNPEGSQKCTQEEWDILFGIALMMGQHDSDRAMSFMGVVISAVFLAAVEFTHSFDDAPEIYITVDGSGCPSGHAFYQFEQAEKMVDEDTMDVVTVRIFNEVEDDEDYEEEEVEGEEDEDGED